MTTWPLQRDCARFYGNPRGADGNPMQAYLAIAQFQHPSGLVAVTGADGLLRFNATVAQVHLGVAVTGLSRPVGTANLILTGTLEGGN